ncbi:ICE2-domain-containing protein [Protomyces lactucae-debilis]|uniref:ICE2-domain-containing protein n=1 Tax=Protomyces lactucae-debilis TaxID=2754530 RepID=A0A1Y2FGN4_PROLT|nr:ICE2-domain-containing protein [Protomyces lactucae-debilis]ORY83100.1 ICE2-domain-containing protein [Protomyces lactucae-debilis]
MSPTIWLKGGLRSISRSIIFLAILISIPLVIEMAGLDAGLAFSLSLWLYYFFLCTVLLLTRSRLWWIGTMASSLQLFVIPTLLIYHLNEFEPEKEVSAFTAMAIRPWRFILTRATPLFTLLEGFASLLIVQAIGQVTRFVTNYRSDSWMFLVLIGSGATLSTSLYFLYRITTFPVISFLNSTMLGTTITASLFIATYATLSGKGTIAESCALFAYTVYSAYSGMTDFGQTDISPQLATRPEYLPFPPLVMENYATLVKSAAKYVPVTLYQTYTFLLAAFYAITPSVLVQFVYRVTSLYAVSRIIPAVRDQGRGVSDTPDLDDEEPTANLMSILTLYWPCSLIAVYTHLLLQHFADVRGAATPFWGGLESAGLWRWINTVFFLGWYAIELQATQQDILTSHWKVD